MSTHYLEKIECSTAQLFIRISQNNVHRFDGSLADIVRSISLLTYLFTHIRLVRMINLGAISVQKT